jgi:hypothetical protein
MADVLSAPNNTLYVSNIDWKTKKALLRRALYALFTRHGKVRFSTCFLLLFNQSINMDGWMDGWMGVSVLILFLPAIFPFLLVHSNTITTVH